MEALERLNLAMVMISTLLQFTALKIKIREILRTELKLVFRVLIINIRNQLVRKVVKHSYSLSTRRNKRINKHYSLTKRLLLTAVEINYHKTKNNFTFSRGKLKKSSTCFPRYSKDSLKKSSTYSLTLREPLKQKLDLKLTLLVKI